MPCAHDAQTDNKNDQSQPQASSVLESLTSGETWPSVVYGSDSAIKTGQADTLTSNRFILKFILCKGSFSLAVKDVLCAFI